MNFTQLEHVVIALVIQGLFIVVFRLIKRPHGEWFGAFFVTALFLGREHAQREYKIGDPSKLIGYEALDIWRWSLDAQLDFLLPTMTVFVVVFFISLYRK